MFVIHRASQSPTDPETPSQGRGRAVALGVAAALAVGVPSAVATAATRNHPDTTTQAAAPGPAPKTLNGKGHHDRGPRPTVFQIGTDTTRNTAYRDTLWTGDHLQLTVMSIKRNDDIGLEMHPQLDQFIRIESGTGVARMGKDKNHLTYTRKVDRNSAVLVPAGTWHDVVNTGRKPLKLYSIYAEPNHPRNTFHKTKQDGKNDPLEKIKYPQDQEAN